MATNQGFANFVPREIPGDFLYYLIDILTPIFKRHGSGTTFDEVNKRDIRKVWCAVPMRPEEQEAIARILDTMDMVIERTRAAVERVRDVKISLVQQLFEKKGYGVRRCRRLWLASYQNPGTLCLFIQ